MPSYYSNEDLKQKCSLYSTTTPAAAPHVLASIGSPTHDQECNADYAPPQGPHCAPYCGGAQINQESCQKAAQILNLSIDYPHWLSIPFVGNKAKGYSPGCYTYSGTDPKTQKYHGYAFYGDFGTVAQKSAALSGDRVRINIDNPCSAAYPICNMGGRCMASNQECNADYDAKIDQESCWKAANNQNLKIGHKDFPFVGNLGYSPGCYTYKDSNHTYHGYAFYGNKGTDAEKRAPLSGDRVRINIDNPCSAASPICSIGGKCDRLRGYQECTADHNSQKVCCGQDYDISDLPGAAPWDHGKTSEHQIIECPADYPYCKNYEHFGLKRKGNCYKDSFNTNEIASSDIDASTGHSGYYNLIKKAEKDFEASIWSANYPGPSDNAGVVIICPSKDGAENHNLKVLRPSCKITKEEGTDKDRPYGLVLGRMRAPWQDPDTAPEDEACWIMTIVDDDEPSCGVEIVSDLGNERAFIGSSGNWRDNPDAMKGCCGYMGNWLKGCKRCPNVVSSNYDLKPAVLGVNPTMYVFGTPIKYNSPPNECNGSANKLILKCPPCGNYTQDNCDPLLLMMRQKGRFPSRCCPDNLE